MSGDIDLDQDLIIVIIVAEGLGLGQGADVIQGQEKGSGGAGLEAIVDPGLDPMLDPMLLSAHPASSPPVSCHQNHLRSPQQLSRDHKQLS